MHAWRRISGFTFVEMMMTLAIMAVLALVAVPMVQVTVRHDREQELRAALQELRSGIDAYHQAVEEGRIEKKLGESGYPHSLDELVEGVTDQRSPDHRVIYFLRRIPRDPFFRDSSVPAADTWGKRSYASPPDDPQEGEDVFDVRSLSAERGLNGIPYGEW